MSEMNGAEDRRPPGRPPMSDWRQRRFLQRLDHGGFSERMCWLPYPGQRTPEKQVVRWFDGNEERSTSARRFLWIQVNAEEDAERPLGWDDVIVAAGSCTNEHCLNPWHQVRTTREELAESMRAWRREQAVGGGPDERMANMARDVDAGFGRFVAGRLVYLGTGDLECAARVERRANDSDALYSALLKRLREAYPDWEAAFDSAIGATVKKRRRIVEHFWRLHPDAKTYCEDNTLAMTYLNEKWSSA